ncbi:MULTISPECIES: magnesium transporter [Rhodomicrobium]|nr:MULTISPECIES: magnesium transporter [Rhodomicrobium]
MAVLRPADAAEALNGLEAGLAARVLEAMPSPTAAQILDEPDLDEPAELIELLPVQAAAAILTGLQPDRRADIFRELSEPTRRALLPRLDAEIRQGLAELLSYPPRSAGGLMTTDFVSVPADWTVAQTLEHIHSVGRGKENVYTICLLDPKTKRLVKVVGLWRLVTGDPKATVSTAAWPYDPISVPPLTDQEEVARLLSKYKLLAVPVVTEHGHLLGIVTVDDVIHAIIEEGTEDVQKLGGSEALDEPYLKIDFLTLIRKRAGWLCILFLSEMLTASAMQFYQAELEKAIVLTLFIPLIMSSGGNSGSQATSLVIRSLALREIGLKDWWRIAARELPAGLVLGALLGVIGVVRIGVWQQLGLFDYGAYWPLVALTVGLALTAIVTFGSVAGSMLPFILKRLGFDPATASAPFVATLVDVTGLVIYFSVAYAVLRGTLL